jgi:hypothetical protein
MSRARVAVIAALVPLAIGATAVGCSRVPTSKQIAAWEGEIARLQVEHDSLAVIASMMIQRDPTVQGVPQGDLILGIPTEFTREATERVLTDVVNQVRLRLTGIRAHVEKKVKKVVTLGTANVDIEVTEIVGSLRPGKPELTFQQGRIGIALPVRVTKGRGSASIHLDWDGKNVAQLACGDLDVTKTVRGNVIPMSTVLRGEVAVGIEGDHVIATPKFPPKVLRLYIEPTPASWDSVRSVLAQKGGLCAFILKKVDLPSTLNDLVRKKGIKVTLHLERLKPFRVPVSVSTVVPAKDENHVSVIMRASEVRIDPERIWIAAEATTAEKKAAAVTAKVGVPAAPSAAAP